MGARSPTPTRRSTGWTRRTRRSVFTRVQSVVVDPRDRLWALDTGSIKLGRNVPGGPKLVGIDLKTNKVFKTILVPAQRGEAVHLPQ